MVGAVARQPSRHVASTVSFPAPSMDPPQMSTELVQAQRWVSWTSSLYVSMCRGRREGFASMWFWPIPSVVGSMPGSSLSLPREMEASVPREPFAFPKTGLICFSKSTSTLLGPSPNFEAPICPQEPEYGHDG